MSRYAIKIEACPFSQSGMTAKEAEAACGPRVRSFVVQARDFEDALTQARCLRDGVGSHDRIWQAHIRSIDYQGEGRP